MYRHLAKTTRIIRILDELGAYRTLRLEDHINIKTHSSALDALAKRAQCFQAKFKSNKDYDEDLIAGAIKQSEEVHKKIISELEGTDSEKLDIQQLLEDKAELLEVQDVAPSQKAEGIVRLVYENVNGLRAQLGGNQKLSKLKVVFDDLEADIFAFNEHKNNLKHKLNKRHGLNQLFFGGDTMARGIWGSNRHNHEDKYLDKKSMEGGTGMVAFGEMASLMNAQHLGTDESGLARWTVMEFRGLDGHNTKILCGYVPCKNNRDNSGTSYQQQRWYFIQKEKKDNEPRRRFLADLKQLLEQWKDNGSCLVVCLDANEDVYKGVIGGTLMDTEGLDMVEAVHRSTGKKLRATHFRGSHPIDAIWTCMCYVNWIWSWRS